MKLLRSISSESPGDFAIRLKAQQFHSLRITRDTLKGNLQSVMQYQYSERGLVALSKLAGSSLSVNVNLVSVGSTWERCLVLHMVAHKVTYYCNNKGLQTAASCFIKTRTRE
jgi:hypothetical protein